MSVRPAVIRDQDKIDVRLTSEAEYRIPFTFIEALNEGTLFDRPAEAFLDAARERRLFQVLNRTTDNIIGTGIIQGSGNEKSAKEAEVGGLMGPPSRARLRALLALSENHDGLRHQGEWSRLAGRGVSRPCRGRQRPPTAFTARGRLQANRGLCLRSRGDRKVSLVSLEVRQRGSRRHHSI